MASSHLNQLFVRHISRLGTLFHMFQPNAFAFKSLFTQDAFVFAASRLGEIETILEMILRVLLLQGHRKIQIGSFRICMLLCFVYVYQ